MSNVTQLLTKLTRYHQWVIRNGSKVPLRVSDFRPASVTNPYDWTDYQTALTAIEGNGNYGLGFVLTADDPFAVIDLDVADGASATPNQIEVFNSFPTYSERSPSGRGCHIWLKGSVPSGKKLQGIEVYSSSRYFTVTNEPVNDVQVADCQSSLDELYSAIAIAQGHSIPTPFESQPQTLSDNDLINRAANADNGELFTALYMGYWQQQYKSQSEADLALVNIIAFYTDNAEQVARIFRQSELGKRPKAKRNDYVGNMVKRSFDRKLPLAVGPAIFTVSTPQIDNVPLPAPKPQFRQVEIVTMSNIIPEAVEWLWEGWLPLKKLALLAGNSGVGKSTLTLTLASIVSNGSTWPDATQCLKPGHVLIWTSEDGISDTLVPRLIAAGANQSRVHIIKATNGTEGKMPFTPSTDIPLLKQQLPIDSGLALVIIDPVISAVEGDMNQANVVRRSLQSLVDFAEERSCCVLGITHFKKNSEGQEPVDRVIGSQAFHALPRTILVAGKDSCSDRRVLAIAKGNVGKDNGGFDYSIQGHTLGNGIKTSRLEWGGELQGSAHEILASVERDTSNDGAPHSSRLEEAKQFLNVILANGTVLSSVEIAGKAQQLHISEITMKRAAKELGVISYKQGFAGRWLWRLPLKLNEQDHGYPNTK